MALSPLAGSEIPLAKVTGGVGTIAAPDIARNGGTSLQDALQTGVPGVVVTDSQGNAFQADVQYRGFTASAVNGTPQGLAVYQNGVRINEVWGDTVNWDALASNAIKGVTVVSNNPVFGLNAIGGAISLAMKDGFSWQGSEVDARAGSFGRRQIGVQTGAQSSAGAASVAGYGALEKIRDGGFRDFSSSNLTRGYADLAARNERGELHLSFTGASNTFGAAAATPVELLRQGWSRTFTTPQTARNDLAMLQANGTFAVTDTFKLSALAYHRRFQQRRVDGNVVDLEDCGGELCFEGTPLNGGGIATPSGPPGTIDRLSTQAASSGVTLQGVERADVFGFGNQLLIGASLDHGRVDYASSSELGVIGPRFVLAGTGITITSPDDLAQRAVRTTTRYSGLYASNTLDVTDRVAVTAGARYNVARLQLDERTGNPAFADLSGTHTFARFNPAIGATFKIAPQSAPGVSLYGGYSEANRAPTPVELACSNPARPCLIESALTSDPPLRQVVARTVEAGLRGDHALNATREKLSWSLGVFRTLNSDDIIAVASPLTGRGFFTNGGDTLRQGVEASVDWRDERWRMFLNYSFVDATFRDVIELAAPNTPSAVPCVADPAALCVNVRPGDRLPGIAAHRLKAGFDVKLTPQWSFGATAVLTSDQVFRGDEANQNARLAGATRVDLTTTYDVTTGVQVYGLVQNLFDQRYGLSGTYTNLDLANRAGAPSGQSFTDPRTVTPAQPFAAYAGVRVRF